MQSMAALGSPLNCSLANIISLCHLRNCCSGRRHGAINYFWGRILLVLEKEASWLCGWDQGTVLEMGGGFCITVLGVGLGP